MVGFGYRPQHGKAAAKALSLNCEFVNCQEKLSKKGLHKTRHQPTIALSFCHEPTVII